MKMFIKNKVDFLLTNIIIYNKCEQNMSKL